MVCLQLFCYSFLLITAAIFATAEDSTSTFHSIKDGETIVSTGGNFELGFFTPAGASGNRYVGIWYKKISVKTVVWVANRDNPLTDSSGILKITSPGILVLVNQNMTAVWSSNTSTSAYDHPVAQLLDSGNLVVKDVNDNAEYLWQSFDYPGDTLLPGMKLGWNTVTGFSWYLTSWRNPSDPSQGNYTFHQGSKGYAEQVLREGSAIRFRTGPWNGVRFSGTPHLGSNHVYNYTLVFDDQGHEEYYTYKLFNSSVLSRLVLTPDGLLRRYTWIDRTQSWLLYLTAQMDYCDNYALCGAYGACNIENSPVCGCLKGFMPKFPIDWDTMDWSNGCVRESSLDCNGGDKFLKYSGVKFPNTEQSRFNISMSLEECKMECTKNCSCAAYSNLYITEGGTGCLMWFGDLNDIRNLTENGQDIYIRMAASEQDDAEDHTKIIGKPAVSHMKRKWIILSCSVPSTGFLVLGLALCLWKRQQRKEEKLRHSKKENLELPLFDLATIVCATNNFSNDNKLGEGGFGCVFKGMLRNGQEIAVKRLSKDSTQGINEFKNEVTHIANLQHRNLVKLLGCCIQADEMMLIYECMPNKSLDVFIFDQSKSMLLDWPKRFDIINGIARGILYLHQDSRLRIIHRDLKASNILLDNEFNPKISDFGLARSFRGNETVAETMRVVGTYGYMSPEYARNGFYSTKSDVFSFGVSVLEIISGKRNRGFSHPGHDLNLLGHAWNLYTEGRAIELLDPSLGNSHTHPPEEVLRSIHVGLLCVQQDSEDRPCMSVVVLMLSGEGSLPQPEKPGFYRDENIVLPLYRECSANDISLTLPEAR